MPYKPINMDLIMGNVYACDKSPNCGSCGTFHFEDPIENSWISYQNTPQIHQKLDDGSPFPQSKEFIEIAYDDQTRTLTAMQIWSPKFEG